MERGEVLQESYRFITRWIPRRKATISAMESVADRVRSKSGDVNTAKVVGSGFGAAAGLTTAIVAIMSTGGLATPLIIVSVVAGVVGVGGAITSGGAEIAKAIELPRLLGIQWTEKSMSTKALFRT